MCWLYICSTSVSLFLLLYIRSVVVLIFDKNFEDHRNYYVLITYMGVTLFTFSKQGLVIWFMFGVLLYHTPLTNFNEAGSGQ